VTFYESQSGSLTKINADIHIANNKEKEKENLEMALNPVTKQRIAIVLDVSKFVFQWGFIPAVLFLG